MAGCSSRRFLSGCNSRKFYQAKERWLVGREAAGLTHAELEERTNVWGWELTWLLVQAYLDLRACEQRHDVVTAVDGIARTRAQKDHAGRFHGVRAGHGAKDGLRGARRAEPAPGRCRLNLPEENHSHGLRRLPAAEAARGSFEDAAVAITRATGVKVGKRQAEQLAWAAARDAGEFCVDRRPGPLPDDVILCLQFDGKCIVTLPGALRPATAKVTAAGRNKLATGLSPGDKNGRKQMAELAVVHDCAPTEIGGVAGTGAGEQSLVRRPYARLDPEWLLIADRNFCNWRDWCAAADTGCAAVAGENPTCPFPSWNYCQTGHRSLCSPT